MSVRDLALVIRNEKRMRPILCRLWPYWLYHIFPHYVKKCTIFGKILEHKIRVLICSTTWQHFSFYEELSEI
jgi:hypothetical protein